jgi:hypothetical protein
LWPDIDKLDKIPHEGTSVIHARDASVHGRRSVENVSRRSRCEGKKDSNDISGTSNMRLKRHGGNSAKEEATQILSAALGVISPRMQRSFVNRRYSSSTGMGLSEWEVILDELIHMGYIVKDEPNSDHNE